MHLLSDGIRVSKEDLVFTQRLHVLNIGIYLVKLQQQILQRNHDFDIQAQIIAAEKHHYYHSQLKSQVATSSISVH